MAWQDTTTTGRIISLATAAENVAFLDTKPVPGGVIDWSDNSSGGSTEGWTDPGFKFTEDDFDFQDNEGNPVVVFPPTCPQKVATLRDEVMVPSQIICTSYEVGEKVYALGSNATNSSGVHTFSATLTRVALIIEVQGLGAHYMPSVEIMNGTPGGGVKTLATQQTFIDIFAGSSVLAGYQWIHWQTA